MGASLEIQIECKEVTNEEVACTLQGGCKTRSIASQAVLVENKSRFGSIHRLCCCCVHQTVVSEFWFKIKRFPNLCLGNQLSDVLSLIVIV